MEALPDVSTVVESVPGYEVSAWYGIGAPKGTSAEITNKLNREIGAALADPHLKARIADFGGTQSRNRWLSLASSSPTRLRSGAR